MHLRRSQKLEAVGQLTGGIAHDFNNHLTALGGSLDLVQLRAAENGLSDEAAKLLEDARRAAERCANLTQELLAFSRRQILEPRTVFLDALLDGMWRLLSRAVSERIELVRSQEANLWSCEVDPTQLESALLNLVLNARDAMPEGGTITIGVSNATVAAALDGQLVGDRPPPGEYVMVSVGDSGCGMKPEQLRRVFEPFYTTKDVGHGSGLGLSMVHGFVSQSRGHVTIASKPGEGTCVRIYLPRSRPASSSTSPATKGATGDEPWPRGNGERILVLEDNPSVRDVLLRSLQALGYRADGVGRGKEALAACGPECPYRLLLTDIVLPGGLTGWQVARKLEQLHPTLRVLYMSGYTGDALPEHADDGVARTLLRKPIRVEHLAAAVRAKLDEGSAAQLQASEPGGPHRASRA